MKKNYFLVIALLLIPLLSSAEERSEQQMQQAALRVLNSIGTHGNRAPRQSSALKLKIKKPKLSVYGYDGGGFAVVTNDDRYNDVIGYSDTEYNDTVMPCGFKWWIETANATMEQTDNQETAYSSIRKSKASVEPFLATKWGQGNPFNALLYCTIGSNSYQFVTGCVATAMAQVMKHYEYPEKGTGWVSYVVWHYLAKMEHTFGDYYDWSNMLDVYNYQEWGSMSTATKAVATLMRDCGMAVEMNYGTESIGSGASSAAIAPALKEHFSYGDKTALYKRSYYSKTNWMQMIYEELSNNRPIIYIAIDKNDEENTSGHAFVLHGYNSSGAVYVNWGWKGTCDGYYDIDLLNPDNYQFSEEQEMVFAVPGNIDIPDDPAPATNSLNVQSVELAPGESVNLDIDLKNDTKNLMGWQCDIMLPEGLTLETKANGKPAATLGNRFANTEHSISSNRLANGAYRFVVTSMDGEAIPGTAGKLFTVTLKANASLAERTGTEPAPTLTGKMTNIEFNTQDNQKLTFDDVAFTVAITGSAPNGAEQTDNILKVQGVEMFPGESVAVNIEMENKATNLMGWQCDIVLPQGLSLALKANGKPAAKLGDRFNSTEHSISSSRLANGAYRFIATSMDGEAIPGTSGTLFTVTLQADASLAERAGTGPAPTLTGTVTNIEFNTQDNQKLTLADVTFSITIPGGGGQKCATPTIAYDKGELVFSCETEGVKFISEVKVADAKSNEEERVQLMPTYIINVYATKDGFEDSDVATATIRWRDGRPLMEGFSSVEVNMEEASDANGDNVVDVADIATVIDIMAAKARQQQ